MVQDRSRVGSKWAQIRTLRRDASDRPFIVIWEMTQACPLACVHCRAEAFGFRP